MKSQETIFSEMRRFVPILASVTLHTLTKIETEATTDPRIETLKKIAKGLNVSVDDLINGN